MITVGYTDGSVVEYSGRHGWACSIRGEVFWYPGEERMVVPLRSSTPPHPPPPKAAPMSVARDSTPVDLPVAPERSGGEGVIDRTAPNVRRWKGPALADVGDVAALFVEMALDLEPPRSATLRVGMHGSKGFCFVRVAPHEIIGAVVRKLFPDVGPVHMASVAVVEVEPS